MTARNTGAVSDTITGSIVNVSSAYGSVGAAGASVYVASKHAVEGMTNPQRWKLQGPEFG